MAALVDQATEPAPPLTFVNVLKAVKNVRSWRTLGQRMIWSYRGELNAIQHQHVSDEACLRAVIEDFLSGRGRYKQPSWRTVIWCLYCVNEIRLAEHIRSFAEPVEDPTLTVENVLGVMEKVTKCGPRKIWETCIADMLEVISSNDSTAKELMYTYTDIYVNCVPNPSWEEIAHGLYSREETAAVEEVRSYLNPRDLTLTTERLLELFALMDDVYFLRLGDYLEIPDSKKEESQMNYQTLAQRKEAYLDYYVHNHPFASWTKIAKVLRSCTLPQQADEVEKTYIQVSRSTRLHFEAAMKDGAIWIRNGSIFFLGPGGSGKTHTLLALLEEDPPVIRESTACAKKPIRAVAQFKMAVSGIAHFIRVTDDHYSEMLAANSAEHFSTFPVNIAHTEQAHGTKIHIAVPSCSSLEVPESLLSPTCTSERVAMETGSQNFGLKHELQCRMQAKSKTTEQLHDKDLMDVKDSGGQPMFHEVLPAFVTNTMFGILTVKLNESLDSQPLVEYYINGSRIGEPFKSPFTHLQTVHHCLKVLQSTCKTDTCPKIIFVGTHKDLEHECQDEDRKEKNRRLQSIIPQEMKDSIVYNGESLLFPINAKSPKNDDRKMMGDLRKVMIKELQKLPKVKIPLRYFSLENAFRRLAKYQRRAILSIDECLKEATAYHFTRESLDDVLQYLHSLKLIMYYKDILPDVVFIDAQVLLDKITELVEYSIELRAKPSQFVAVGGLEKFKTCGIVTTEILSKFSSGYVPGLFEEKHVVILFKKLLIVAEIGKGKYLMPSLLEEEKAKLQFNSSLVVPNFLLYFGENGPKLGVYCFLLASLITDANWKLLTENGNPVQLSRNRVRFTLPGNNPGCITITDSFSTFFDVSIEFPDKVTKEKAIEICKNICPKIRETLLTHIRRASRRLNYINSIPVASFLCSQHDESTPPHPATISDTGLLTCTTHPRSVCSELADNHKLWLGEAECSSHSPSDKAVSCTSDPSDAGKLNIKDLRKVQKAAWEARTKWYNIGLELNIDPETLDTIKGNNSDIDVRFRAMLTTWLKMLDPKPTWEALAEALRSPSVGREHLADLIESSQRH